MSDSKNDAGAADVNSLQAKLNELDERSKRFEGLYANAEKELAKFKGIDLEKLRADSEALTQMMREKANSNPEDAKKLEERIEQKIRTTYQQQLDDTGKENKALKGKLHEFMTVDRALSTVGSMFNEDAHVFVKGMIRDSMDCGEDGAIFIKDEKGTPRYSKTKPAEKMSLKEWAEEIATRHPSIAKSTVASGSKVPGQEKMTTGAGDPDIQRFIKMTPEQRQALPRDTQLALSQKAIRMGYVS